ncbi:MAG: hypothetical protein ACODAF_02180 [Actinomycetota bacterium]
MPAGGDVKAAWCNDGVTDLQPGLVNVVMRDSDGTIDRSLIDHDDHDDDHR